MAEAKWWHTETRRERDRLREDRERLDPVFHVAGELAARLAGEDAPSLDRQRQVAAELEPAERDRRTLAALDSLPPAERYAILAETMGDEDLQALLAARHEAAVQRAAFTDAIKELAQEGRTYDMLNLSRVPLRATVDLELYDRGDFEEVDGKLYELVGKEDPQRLLSVVARGDDLFTVANDMLMDDATRGFPFLGDHSVVRIGSFGPAEPAEGGAEPTRSIEPTLYLGSGVACAVEDEVELLGVRTYERTETDLILGKVMINNHFVLGPGNVR